MNPSASVAIACLLIFPVVVTAQMSTIRGVGADERLDQGQKADLCHGHVASHLSHPLFVRMRRDAGDCGLDG